MTTVVATTPYAGQRPGTSGLRVRTTVAQQPNYIENFVQSSFDALDGALVGKTLACGGDGRFLNNTVTNLIIRMAAAHGVSKMILTVNHLFSTPAVSFIIRDRKCVGGFILTASHNAGGPKGDFGIKYNCANGGPAPSSVTEAIYQRTAEIKEYKIATAEVNIDFSQPGTHQFGAMDVEVVDAPAEYVRMCSSIFDFNALRALVAREDFSFAIDGMYGVAGPYAQKIFVEELKGNPSCLQQCTPSEDFNGGHPDPNLTYAKNLVQVMGLGTSQPEFVPSFGAAADGDADRNMVLGSRFFVTPSDSVAIIAANATACIPYFASGLKGVARSMPTSGALDLVAAKLGVECNEVPTGWKYFGNLMDAGRLSICGEESFGTGSDHIREKDGVWAMLCWLSILANKNPDPQAALVSVEAIVRAHWAEYGRNYYQRYDYEEVDAKAAQGMMEHLRGEAKSAQESKTLGPFGIRNADDFTYTDPVDGAVATKQGIRFVLADGSRIIFRLSGTGSVGATIRLYVEKYESDSSRLDLNTTAAVAPLIQQALAVSGLAERTGRTKPTVIT